MNLGGEEGKKGEMGGKTILPEDQPSIHLLPVFYSTLCACPFSSTQLLRPLQLGFCPLVFSKCSSLLSASLFFQSALLIYSPQHGLAGSPSRISLLQPSGSSLAPHPSSLCQFTKPVDMLAKSTFGFPRNSHFVWCRSRSSATDGSNPRRQAL